MKWNHRVIRKTHSEGFYFEIHEVYYNKNKPTMWTDDSVKPYGETLLELQEELRLFSSACTKPVLEIQKQKNKEILVECIL